MFDDIKEMCKFREGVIHCTNEDNAIAYCSKTNCPVVDKISKKLMAKAICNTNDETSPEEGETYCVTSATHVREIYHGIFDINIYPDSVVVLLGKKTASTDGDIIAVLNMKSYDKLEHVTQNENNMAYVLEGDE